MGPNAENHCIRRDDRETAYRKWTAEEAGRQRECETSLPVRVLAVASSGISLLAMSLAFSLSASY